MPTSRHLPRRLFDAVLEMNAAATRSDFISAVTAGLHRLILCDYCSIQFLDRRTGQMLHHTAPENPYNGDEVAYFSANPHEDALVAHYEKTGDQSARRRSDVLDTRQFIASDYYRHCHARLGLKYSLALPVVVDAHVAAGISCDRRARDFSKRDCALLDAFAPHFRLAWQRHRDPWHISRKPQPDNKGVLTSRETEVVYWITQGKQNREIAMILGISFFTVQKHVANILRKLEVENRHALTVLALNRATDE